MTQKIKAGAVSYLNTKPLIYGFEQGQMKNEVELLIDYPSKIASLLLHNDIDLGLVPVAVLPEMDTHFIISDYGIACDGDVASVCLFSQVPLEHIDTVVLDYQSRTSVALLKILLAEYWHISPKLVQATGDFEMDIAGTTAGLVIGDRAFIQRQKSAYVYDLGGAWKAHTGLPFVFAAWISNKKLPYEFCREFTEATRAGLDAIDTVVANNPYPNFNLDDYYRKFIKFRLDTRMHQGLNLFLSKLKHAV